MKRNNTTNGTSPKWYALSLSEDKPLSLCTKYNELLVSDTELLSTLEELTKASTNFNDLINKRLEESLLNYKPKGG